MSGVTLENLFETTDEGIVVFDPVYNDRREVVDFRYRRVNSAALRMLRRSRDELIDHLMLKAFPGIEKSNLFQQYRQVMDTGSSVQTEFLYQHDGLDSWFKNQIHRLDEQLMVRFSDITEYKVLLEEKSRNEGLSRALIRALPSIDVALIDRQYYVRIAKGHPLLAYGYEDTIPDQVKLTDLLEKREVKRVTQHCRECFKGQTRKEEITVGEAKHRISFAPVYDHRQRVFGCLIVVEDISVFNLSEDELRNKLYALESTRESLEQFAYVASHDLQEPLRKIRAFGDRINTRFADQLDETGRDYFMRMQNAAQRMQVLIDDLLKYSRVGRIQNAFEPVDLNTLMQGILTDMETTIEESGAVVEVDELPTVEGEASQLRQLFQNLISNAIKFRKETAPPHITIRSQLAQVDETDSPQLSDSGVVHEVTVADNGIGFDEKYLDRIFNIFQRLHGRTQYPGTGIGLAICRKIVENHQGDIFANSEINQGATFHVLLPQTQQLSS